MATKKKSTKSSSIKKTAKKTTKEKVEKVKKVAKIEKPVENMLEIERVYSSDITISIGRIYKTGKMIGVMAFIEDSHNKIPAGEYPTVAQWTNREGNHFLILNIKNRQDVTIKASDTVPSNGIAPIGNIFYVKGDKVEGSVLMMQQLWSTLKDGFILKIR